MVIIKKFNRMREARNKKKMCNPFVTAGRFFDTFFEFLGGKTEVIYLYYSPFYTYLHTLVKICAKKGPKCGGHC